MHFVWNLKRFVVIKFDLFLLDWYRNCNLNKVVFSLVVALGFLVSSSFLSIFFVIPFFMAKLTWKLKLECQLDPITGSTESREGTYYLSCTVLSWLENLISLRPLPFKRRPNCLFVIEGYHCHDWYCSVWISSLLIPGLVLMATESPKMLVYYIPVSDMSEVMRNTLLF